MDVVVEVLFPGDDTYRKFPFSARHGVREIIVADPDTARIEIHTLDPTGTTRYTRTDVSALLGGTAADLVSAVDWPSRA